MTKPLPLLSRRTLIAGAALTVPSLAYAAPRVVLPAEDALSEDLVLRDPEAPIAGAADGDISIVAYSDYNCPYCRKAEVDLRQAVRDDGKVRLVFKDWPVLGPDSVYAARMAVAAKFQDKYLAAHEALIGQTSRLTPDSVRATLAAAGIDVAKASADLDARADAIAALLKRNDTQAKAFGFRGTPAYIVGKFRVGGALTAMQFERAIADARKAGPVNKGKPAPTKT